MKNRGKELEGEMDKFYSRYTALKPKEVSELDRESA